jgi:hypothetical protein
MFKVCLADVFVDVLALLAVGIATVRVWLLIRELLQKAKAQAETAASSGEDVGNSPKRKAEDSQLFASVIR